MAIDLGEFSSPTKPRGKEGVVFQLAGETFTTLPEAPAGTLNDLMAGINIDQAGNRVFSAPNLIRFVIGVLREEEALTAEEAAERGVQKEPDAEGMVWVRTDDVTRFNGVVYGKRHIVELDELGELVMKLGEVLGDRPTRPSGRSARGR